jgi:uroporphyrinogen-III synthase
MLRQWATMPQTNCAARPAKASSMNERRRRRALITRPQEDSADAAIALARQGITPVLAPMMRIEHADVDIENEVALAQAVLFTSRNGVRAFTRLSQRRDVAVFTVGDSTAMLARDNGFVHVESAHGDSADLARLVKERLDPADGLLFHAAGVTVAGELVDTLNKAGFKTVRRALYEARPVDSLSDDTVTALRDRTLDYILFFSPRTARIFRDLVGEAGLDATCDSLIAICLSDAVAAEISELAWKATSVATAPTTEALLTILSSFEGDPVQTPAGAPPEIRPAAESTIERATESPADAAEEMGAPALEPPPHEPRSSVPATTKSDPPNSDAPNPDTEKPVTKIATPAEQPDTKPAAPVKKTRPKTTAPEKTEPPKQGSNLVRSLPMAAGIAAVVLAAAYTTLPSWRDRLPVDIRERLAGTDVAATALRGENTELKARIEDLDKVLVAANAELAATRNKAGQEIGNLTTRLATSEKDLTALRETAGTAAATAETNRALREKVTALEKALTAATEAGDGAAKKLRDAEAAQAQATQKSAEATGALNAKIATIEKDLAAAQAAALSASKSDTVALAAGKLRDAVARARPFADEIAALKRLGGSNPDIAQAVSRIEPFAARGVPTRSTLFAELPATVGAVLDAARAPAETGWIGRVTSKLTGFVTVRRIDGKGEGADAVVARAEIQARRGDLAAAVKELTALTGPAAKAAAPWIADAQSRLTAEGASEALDRIVLGAFAKGGDR